MEKMPWLPAQIGKMLINSTIQLAGLINYSRHPQDEIHIPDGWYHTDAKMERACGPFATAEECRASQKVCAQEALPELLEALKVFGWHNQSVVNQIRFQAAFEGEIEIGRVAILSVEGRDISFFFEPEPEDYDLIEERVYGPYQAMSKAMSALYDLQTKKALAA